MSETEFNVKKLVEITACYSNRNTIAKGILFSALKGELRDLQVPYFYKRGIDSVIEVVYHSYLLQSPTVEYRIFAHAPGDVKETIKRAIEENHKAYVAIFDGKDLLGKQFLFNISHNSLVTYEDFVATKKIPFDSTGVAFIKDKKDETGVITTMGGVHYLQAIGVYLTTTEKVLVSGVSSLGDLLKPQESSSLTEPGTKLAMLLSAMYADVNLTDYDEEIATDVHMQTMVHTYDTVNLSNAIVERKTNGLNVKKLEQVMTEGSKDAKIIKKGEFNDVLSLSLSSLLDIGVDRFLDALPEEHNSVGVTGINIPEILSMYISHRMVCITPRNTSIRLPYFSDMFDTENIEFVLN